MKVSMFFLLFITSISGFAYECNIPSYAKVELSKSILREVVFRKSKNYHEAFIKTVDGGRYDILRVLDEKVLTVILDLGKDGLINKLCIRRDDELNPWDREEEFLELIDIEI